MGHRHEAREFAMQALFSVDIQLKRERLKQNLNNNKEDVEQECIQCFCKVFESQLSCQSSSYFHILLKGVKEHQDRIDKLIEEHSKNWKISKMSYVDINIMRVACYEFLFCHDVPSTVAINEAIDIAKDFASFESSSFINGILDSIRRTLEKK